MANYPILNPVTCPIGTLVHLGAMERSFVPALEAFTNGITGGLTVPEIDPRWQAIRSVPLSKTTPRAFASSARRMVDEANALATLYREYRDRTSPDATIQFTLGHSDEEASEEKLRVKERLEELTGALNPPSRTTLIPGKMPWFLVPLAQPQRNVKETLFVNQDSRAIHIKQVYRDSVFLGYGLHAGAMHYMDISPEWPTGRSRAAFLKEPLFAYNATPVWLSNLATSLQKFYVPQTISLSGKVRLTLYSQKRFVSQSQPLNAGNAVEFKDAVRHISPGNEIVIESEELITTSKRGSAVSEMNNIVPITSVRCVFEPGVVNLYRTYHFPQLSKFEGESALSDDFKKRLRFPGAPAR